MLSFNMREMEYPMPFEAPNTLNPDLPLFEANQGVNGSMRRVRESAERLTQTSKKFENNVSELQKSFLYLRMKEILASIKE